MGEQVLTLAEIVEGKARTAPNLQIVRDLERALTYQEWNDRANRLANALCQLGLARGDRVAVLAYNCLEWAEIYIATAKAGLIAVPINFRLAGPEIQFILEDAAVKAVIAQHDLAPLIEGILGRLQIAAPALIHFGAANPPSGWASYEALIEAADCTVPAQARDLDAPWALMYTSGTTGNPKGAIRNQRGMSLLSLVTAVELSIQSQDDALLVMPMCHANSLNFFCSYLYSNAKVTIYSRKNFDAQHVLSVMSEQGITFTSLVPTQYIMFLELPEQVKAQFQLQSIKHMMVSSAPARAETKRAVMAMFPNTGLFELYGSSEAGWVTMLHPQEQFSNLGSVGRECVGSAPIRLLDANGCDVPDGQPGELYSRTPYAFSGYWNQPEKTAKAFQGDYCSVGDIAYRDEAGFIRLVDRKENMIISGGENIYPTEVEKVLASYPAVQDAAVVGMPDQKWGESVHAAVVLRPGQSGEASEIIAWCREHLAGYKCPRSISFLTEDQLPRTATGKVRHRALRAQLLAD